MKDQMIALVTFFAFPIIQYGLLKLYARKEGAPELWFLPDYGFRLVLRNLTRQKTLFDIKYRVTLRHLIPPTAGSSVTTYEDNAILQKDEMFLLPDSDQILFSFKVDLNRNARISIINTNKLGEKASSFELFDSSQLIVDYEARVKNLFNFDIKIAKRVIITEESLHEYWQYLQEQQIERTFKIDRLISIS